MSPLTEGISSKISTEATHFTETTTNSILAKVSLQLLYLHKHLIKTPTRTGMIC